MRSIFIILFGLFSFSVGALLDNIPVNLLQPDGSKISCLSSGDEFYDGLKFYINGELISQFQPDEHGDANWGYYEQFINSGNYSFSWSYVKDGGDGSTASEIDCAWIDDLFFPISEHLF